MTRRHFPLLRCRPCRFQKCKSVGMKNLQMSCPPKPKQLDIIENRMQQCVDFLTHLESKLDEYRMSAYNPPWNDTASLVDILENEGKLGLAAKYGPMPGWPLPLETETTVLPLSQMRNVTGNELQWSPTKKLWTICNMMTVVEYMKCFEVFKELLPRDKFLLARHVIMICRNLHVSFFAFSKKCDSCLQPDGIVEPQRDEKHYYQMVMSIAPLIRMRVQKIEYLLLKAICFCNPAVTDLSTHAQSLLATQRNQFAMVLFDYCKRNYSNGPCRFSELIGLCSLLENQQKMQKDFFVMNISPVYPRLPLLLRDVMDC